MIIYCKLKINGKITIVKEVDFGKDRNYRFRF